MRTQMYLNLCETLKPYVLLTLHVETLRGTLEALEVLKVKRMILRICLFQNEGKLTIMNKCAEMYIHNICHAGINVY